MKKSLIVILLFILVGGACTWWAVLRADRELRLKLIQQAALVADAVKLDCVKALAGTADDLTSPNYQQLKQQLTLARQVNGKCRFLYLLGRKANGTVFFYVDSEPAESKDCSPAGQIYGEAPEGYRRLFDTNAPDVAGPVSDRWGTWFTALVPINDPATGRLVAVFCMDIDARDWSEMRASLATPPVLFILALAAIQLAATLLLRRRSRMTAALPRWMRHIELACAILVGLTLTLCAAWIAQKRAVLRTQDEFSRLAKGRTDAIAEAMRHACDTELESLALFCEGQEQISAGEFRRFTVYLTKNPAVQAWEWIPAVASPDKPRIEAEARAMGLAGFEIWQKDGRARREPATGREFYYPVLHIAPLEGNEPALGYDLGSDLLRRKALEAAERSGLTTATDPVILVQDTTRQKGLLLFRPVFSLNEPKRLRGFAVAAMRMGSMLDRLSPESSIHTTLSLLRRDAAPEKLAETYDGALNSSAGLALTRPFFLFDKTLAITAHASSKFQNAHPMTMGWIAFITGLLLTVILSKVITMILHGQEELRQAVLTQTAALRKSEECMAATLRSIGDGVVATDAAGRVANLNAVAEQLTGWTNAEAAGCPIEEIFRIVHTKTRDTVENPVGQTLLKGVGVSLANHTVLIARDGTERQIADSCAPIRNADGTTIGAVLVVRDVTDEYNQRERLRDSEEKYRLLVDHSSDLIWNLSEDGVFTYASPSWKRVTGHAAAAIVGTSLQSLVHPDDFPLCQKHLDRMVRFDETQASLEFRARHADGTWHWHAVNVTLALGPESQRVPTGGLVPFVSLVGVSRDITDRKRSELQLQESERLQRLLLESIGAGVVIIDAATHVIERVNRKGAELFGVAEDQILGNICHRFICPAEAGRCPITDLGQEINNSERVLVKSDGSHLPILKSARRIRIDGREKILGTFIDISDRALFTR